MAGSNPKVWWRCEKFLIMNGMLPIMSCHHNEINTRSELKKYDPELAKLILEWFVDDDWRFKYPRL